MVNASLRVLPVLLRTQLVPANRATQRARNVRSRKMQQLARPVRPAQAHPSCCKATAQPFARPESSVRGQRGVALCVKQVASSAQALGSAHSARMGVISSMACACHRHLSQSRAVATRQTSLWLSPMLHARPQQMAIWTQATQLAALGWQCPIHLLGTSQVMTLLSRSTTFSVLLFAETYSRQLPLRLHLRPCLPRSRRRHRQLHLPLQNHFRHHHRLLRHHFRHLRCLQQHSLRRCLHHLFPPDHLCHLPLRLPDRHQHHRLHPFHPRHRRLCHHLRCLLHLRQHRFHRRLLHRCHRHLLLRPTHHLPVRSALHLTVR